MINRSTNNKEVRTCPYFRYEEKGFSLVIPEQVLKTYGSSDLRWVVESPSLSEIIRVNPGSVHGVTSCKIEQEMIPVEAGSIFDSFHICLMDSEYRLKAFLLPKEIIRFFDNEGHYIRNDELSRGGVLAFTEAGEKPLSEAVIESGIECGLTKTTFELEDGDIIRIPGGKPITVGGTLKEGLLPRGKVTEVMDEATGKRIPVYETSPKVLVKMHPRRTIGTAIFINKRMFRCLVEEDSGIEEFDLCDSSENKGYLIDLGYFGCKKDGAYNVMIDVPNDRTVRQWEFCLSTN